MRSLWFMPVTFFAGQDGFLLFAPYLAVFLAVAHLLKARRVRQLFVQRAEASKYPLAATSATASMA